MPRNDANAQAAISAQAAEIAATHVSDDASLPWLERLRALRSEDASVSARIAEVHRRAGRPEAVLRALENAQTVLCWHGFSGSGAPGLAAKGEVLTCQRAMGL